MKRFFSKVFFKKLTIFFGYFILISLGINYYLRFNKNNKTDDKFFYDELIRIGYYENKFNPYEKANNLGLHPTNFFSLPIKSYKKERINNNVFSLNKNGYRNNPNAPKLNEEHKKECILFLGSSAGFGVGASSDQTTIPAILNKKLGDKYYIFNLAVPSWNSRQELISILNFMEKNKSSFCTSINSISFSGTSDIYSIIHNFNSSLYEDSHSFKELINAPEHYKALEVNVKAGKQARSNMKYNLEKIVSQIINSLFGEFLKKFVFFNKENQKLATSTDIELNEKLSILLQKQMVAFVKNQKFINEIIKSLGGSHLLVIQPDMHNQENKSSWWKYTNNELSKSLKDSKCLNIIDMRFSLLGLNESDQTLDKKYINKLSLKESILQREFKDDDLKSYLFYDKSHLTDSGNLIVSDKIADNFLNAKAGQKCFSNINLQNK